MANPKIENIKPGRHVSSRNLICVADGCLAKKNPLHSDGLFFYPFPDAFIDYNNSCFIPMAVQLKCGENMN